MCCTKPFWTVHNPTLALITDLDYRFSAFTVWNYLCAHQDLERLKTWINVMYGDKSEASAEVEWPFNLKIDFDLAQNLSQCSQYLKHEILNELAR